MTTHHVETVLGPVAVEEVGITLPHEHLLVDLVVPYFEQPSDDPDGDAIASFTAAMRERALVNCNAFADNLRLDDVDAIVAELEPFAAAGGSTIVELSSVDIGRDPVGLRDISRRAGVHVVMGCGYYIDRSQPPPVRSASARDLANEMGSDLLEGPGETGVRAGSSARSELTRSPIKSPRCCRRPQTHSGKRAPRSMSTSSSSWEARPPDAGPEMSSPTQAPTFRE